MLPRKDNALGDSRVRVQVKVPASELEQRIERKARQLSGTLKLPGFRRGKVPSPLRTSAATNSSSRRSSLSALATSRRPPASPRSSRATSRSAPAFVRTDSTRCSGKTEIWVTTGSVGSPKGVPLAIQRRMTLYSSESLSMRLPPP